MGSDVSVEFASLKLLIAQLRLFEFNITMDFRALNRENNKMAVNHDRLCEKTERG